MVKMYANESPGEKFPPMKTRRCDGTVASFDTIFSGEATYPEYSDGPQYPDLSECRANVGVDATRDV